jgi:hypothetical protein
MFLFGLDYYMLFAKFSLYITLIIHNSVWIYFYPLGQGGKPGDDAVAVKT